MTRSSFESIIGYNHQDDINWKQATLKIKFSGFGLTQISQISPTAFLSSWCQAMKDLPERFSSFFDLVSYLQSNKSLSGSIGSTVASSYQALPPMPKSNHEDGEQQSLDNFISYPKKLQHRLSTKIASDSATDIIIQAQSDRDAARLKSLQGRGAGAWLDVIPTSAKYALKTNEFSLASYLRLGVALPFTNWIKKCDCGHDLYEYGYHLLTCKYGGGPVWSHNSVLNGWSECLFDLHLPHKTEPRHQY